MANNRELSQFASTVGHSGGNIGIGTDNPGSRLHVDSGTDAVVGKFVSSNTSAAVLELDSLASNYTELKLKKNGTVYGNLQVAFNDLHLVQQQNANLKFYTNNTERLRITSGGNISVGGATGGDFSLLDGIVTNTANGSAGLLINSSSSSHNAYLGFSYGSGSSTSHADQFSAYIGRVGDNTLILGTDNNIRVRIDPSGHLLHGVSADEDTSGNGGLRFINSGDIQIDGDQRALVFRSTNNTAQLQSAIEWWNENGAGVQSKIACDRTAVSQAPSDLVFYTSSNVDLGGAGNDGAIAERLRITSGGNVGINTDNPTTILEIGDSNYGSNLAGSVGFQISSLNATDATGVAFNMVQKEGYKWIQYHGTGTSWVGKGNYGFVWNDGVTESTGLSVGITTEGYIVGNRNVVQVIDATTATRFNGSGVNTLITSSVIKCNSNKSRFMIHVHCPVNTSDDSDAGNGNMNPYFAGYVQRNLNGSGWTDCGGKGSSSQGGHSAHIEMSPNRTGNNNSTDYFSGNRYRMEHKYVHFFDDELSPGVNNTIQFRLRVVNHGGGNWIQIGEPQGYGTDDNYPCQRWGMMIYELGPDTRFTVQNKAP